MPAQAAGYSIVISAETMIKSCSETGVAGPSVVADLYCRRAERTGMHPIDTVLHIHWHVALLSALCPTITTWSDGVKGYEPAGRHHGYAMPVLCSCDSA